MKQRIMTALLCACLCLATALPALAAPAGASLEEAAQAVTALGIMTGDSQSGMDLGRKVTRAEFITMAVRATPGGDRIGQAATSPYPDVPRSHWASGFVEAAVSMGLAAGYSDGTFRPDRQICLAEAVDTVLALLGYGPEDIPGAFPTGQMALYHSLRLDRGVSALAPDAPLTRQDAMYLFYALLSARTKQGEPYINTLGHSLDASGKVDLLALVNGQMEGPLVARRGWQSALPFVPDKVLRGGSAVGLADIQDYDVVYWNAAMGTVWAYSQKATGAIQALEPSSGSPTSVTVAGRSYPIDASSAAYALSDLGQYHLGDTVTLLLGRTGGVVAVADAAAGAGDQVGVIVEVSRQEYPDGAGGTYTAQSVKLLATDGQIYQYQSQGGYREGSVVRAAAGKDNRVTLKGLSSSPLSGKVSADGTKLGELEFAQDVQILDVSGQYGAVLYPRRLAGVELSQGQVRYYSLNGLGQIDRLILEEVTGDMYQYGVLTRLEEMGQGLSKYYNYEYDVGGVPYTIPGSTTRWRVHTGPIQLLGPTAGPEKMYSLTEAPKGQLSGDQFLSGNRKYTLSDGVQVYELRNGSWFLSSRARVEGGGFELSGWYDKTDSQGGRIRVIVAKAR